MPLNWKYAWGSGGRVFVGRGLLLMWMWRLKPFPFWIKLRWNFPPLLALQQVLHGVCLSKLNPLFTHWHLAGTHILIPRCHAAKYWKATRNIKSAYLLSARQWHCTGGWGRGRGWQREVERRGVCVGGGVICIHRKAQSKTGFATSRFSSLRFSQGENYLGSTQRANHQASQFARAIWQIISLLLVLNSA